MQKLPENDVAYIMVCITIKTDKMTFKDVKNAYCRVLFQNEIGQDTFEFCKYELSSNKDGKSTGSLPVLLRKTNGYW